MALLSANFNTVLINPKLGTVASIRGSISHSQEGREIYFHVGLGLRFLAGLRYTLGMTVEQRIEKTTRAALAQGLGVDASHVRHVLRGTRVPSLEVAARIAKKLGVSLDAFYRYYSKRAVVQESVN